MSIEMRRNPMEANGLRWARQQFMTEAPKNVLRDFDVVTKAGDTNRTLVREFRNIAIKDKLTVSLIPAAGAANPQPILSGIEVVLEEPVGSD